ncbi:MAG: PrgI family protein, partial [Actinobacteria bacterium]|nr:PrgI family protein [Actinomycetota bacterium]
MSTYTVIQDIEAEDKLFGPLTLKQFIFACITVVSGYLSFWSVMNELVFLLIVFLPPTLFFAALAFPWSKDQTTEVWMMAKLRYFFRPRKRIWDQSGIKNLVTITAPKREHHEYTDGLSNTEVKSRLRALADTIDSRGWAVKGADLNIQVQPSYASNQSDRLVGSGGSPQQVANYDVRSTDDMLDEQNNPEAQKLNQMMQQSATNHRDEILEKISVARSHTTESEAQPDGKYRQTKQASPQQNTQDTTADYWFMRQPAAPQKSGYATYGASQVVTPGQKTSSAPSGKKLTAEEQAALDKIHQSQSRPDPSNSHLKT